MGKILLLQEKKDASSTTKMDQIYQPNFLIWRVISLSLPSLWLQHTSSIVCIV